MTLTDDEATALGTTIHSLLDQMYQLCDYIARHANQDEPPPECFLVAFQTLRNAVAHAQTFAVIEKVMKH